jgi:hypothetical protein
MDCAVDQHQGASKGWRRRTRCREDERAYKTSEYSTDDNNSEELKEWKQIKLGNTYGRVLVRCSGVDKPVNMKQIADTVHLKVNRPEQMHGDFNQPPFEDFEIEAVQDFETRSSKRIQDRGQEAYHYDSDGSLASAASTFSRSKSLGLPSEDGSRHDFDTQKTKSRVRFSLTSEQEVREEVRVTWIGSKIKRAPRARVPRCDEPPKRSLAVSVLHAICRRLPCVAAATIDATD